MFQLFLDRFRGPTWIVLFQLLHRVSDSSLRRLAHYMKAWTCVSAVPRQVQRPYMGSHVSAVPSSERFIVATSGSLHEGMGLCFSFFLTRGRQTMTMTMGSWVLEASPPAEHNSCNAISATLNIGVGCGRNAPSCQHL